MRTDGAEDVPFTPGEATEMNDESVIEWASGWLGCDVGDSTFRARFAEGLASELKSRRQEVEHLETWAKEKTQECAEIRAALIRALDDVRRGNENVEKLLAELKAERERWEASRQALLVAYDRWDREGGNVDQILTVARGIISRSSVSPTESERQPK